MLKKKTLFIPELSFDSSGSSVVRFFKNPISGIKIHIDGSNKRIHQICPNSIYNNENMCKICLDNNIDSKITTYDNMNIILCWDIKKSKWSILLLSYYRFTTIFSILSSIGCSNEIIEKGLGPDIIITYYRQQMNFEPIKNNCRVIRGNGIIPDMNLILNYIEKKSKWNIRK